MTRRSGKWEPVWYKAGVVTRHCRRVALKSGREILVCEETDGGMGHQIHGLYVVDFTKPEFAWDHPLLIADRYSGFLVGGVQEQFIDRVQFGEGGLRVYARHGNAPLDLARPVERLPVPKVARYQIEFTLDEDRLKVTAETAQAAKLFGVDLK